MVVYVREGGLPDARAAQLRQDPHGRRLAGDAGLVCETDEYFYTQVGDDPTYYDFSMKPMEQVRRWNIERFKKAVDAGVTPVVVDRGNGGSSRRACTPDSQWIMATASS